jgi:glycosyltransferase involved in cell wall biosynthesis
MARWNSANMSRYYHLFRAMADAGHTVVVVQPPPRKSEETNYIDLPMQSHPRIQVFTAHIPGWLWNPRFPLDKFVKKATYTVATWFLLRRQGRQHGADVLVVYNLPQYLYAIGSSLPVVFDYADDYLAMLAQELGVSMKHPLVRMGNVVLQLLIRRSSLVTCVSQGLVDLVEHPRVALVPNGANPGPHATDTPALHIDRSSPVIGYVGAFEYFIDLALMLETAQRMPDCTFLFVGAGREFGHTKEEIARRGLTNVILTGAVPHAQAMKFVQEMDLCLNLFVPGRVSFGASPIKVFEYLAREKPIVSTRLPELLRIDPDGEVFLFADCLDEVLTNIRRMLDGHEERRRRVEKGVLLLVSGFTWAALAESFARHIGATLSSARKGGM